VAREDTFEGQLRTTRGVRVLGTVRGGIESSQYVHIEENAHVEADITAEEVVIAGEYSGKLTCRQRVEIRATGRVTGQIDTQKLLLHEGGYFDGEMRMQKPAGGAAAPAARTETEDNRPRRTRYVDISSDTSAPREVGSSDPTS
jgi:cytoskeletal protein CcmA (bactofilin family)